MAQNMPRFQAYCGRGEPRFASAAEVECAKLLDFYRNDYLPKTRTSVGARDLPDGDAFYRAQIRQFTTTDMSPEDIHQLGLKEVARIDRAMQQAMPR